jgi:DNA processing protein
MLKDEVLFAWWTLSSIPGIGSIALNKIREQLPNCQQLVECSAQDLIVFGLKADLAEQWQEYRHPSSIESQQFVLSGWNKIQTWCQQAHCGVLIPDDEDYPESLASLKDAPVLLFYRGDTQLLKQASLAIVGSRNPSHYGSEQAFTIAQQMITSDWHVVSGLAIGIDGQAHKGALNNATGIGRGKTIAVLGSGLNAIYPKRHQELAEQIVASGGLLLSEHLPDIKALARHFPMRNRIVSAISRGTLVIEAAYKSGSLITARLAAEQGREVFALPGAVTNPLSRGCHQLIKEGANLVEGASDILSLLNSELVLQHEPQADLFSRADAESSRNQSNNNQPLRGDTEGQIFQALDVVPVAIDQLVNRTGLAVAEITQHLILMELKGLVAQVPGGYVRL